MSENVWTYAFKNLPKFKPGLVGAEITYTVSETLPEGYDSSLTDNQLGITNTARATAVNVSKTWDDMGLAVDRPDPKIWLEQSIDNGSTWVKRVDYTLEGLADEEEVSFSGLPLYSYKSGSAVKCQYRVVEETLGNYMSTISNPVIPADGATDLSITNTATRLTLNKVGANNAPLAGSTFSIEGTFASNPNEVATKPLPAGSGEGAYLLTGELIAGNQYTITETASTEGYSVMAPFVVTIDNNGAVSLVGEARADVSMAEGTVVAKNTPTAVSIVKVDNSTPAQQMAGASLKLTGKFAGTTETALSWTSSDTEAKDLAGQLIVGEEYMLTETERMAGYLAFPGEVKFKLTDAGTIKVTSNPKYVDGTDAVTLSDNKLQLAVRNVAVKGVVTLQKVDAETEQPLNGVTFALYDAEGKLVKDGLTTGHKYTVDGWAASDAAAGELTLSGVDLGTYYLQETAATGYQVPNNHLQFFISNDNAVQNVSIDLGTIKNKPTELSFTKVELYVEECSDPELGTGAPDPNSKRPLESAEFTAYSDEACTAFVAKATSDANGRVTFKKLESGKTYWLKETVIPDGHKPSDQKAKAVFAADGTLTSFGLIDAETGVTTPGIATEITNDVVRTDISIMKVSETDPEKTLPNSTYGLFEDENASAPPQMFARALFAMAPKAASTDGLKLIAKATTDERGMLTFKGVLMNKSYIIQELEAPDGSLVSKNPIKLEYEIASNGEVKVSTFDDGLGTAKTDPVTGEIIWSEPQVTLSFDKTDESGKLLAGARLQVVDEAGRVVVEPWTSSADAGHVVEGVLVGGQKYKLQELQAPSGYDLAADVEFTVDATPAAAGENRVQHVVMVNKLTPVAGGTPPSGTPGTSTPAPSVLKPLNTLTKTGDPLTTVVPIVGVVALAAVAAGGIAATRRRKKR